MNRGEYWLLDYVVELQQSMNFLGLEPEMLERFINRPGHGLSRPELVDTLDKLFKNGCIVAEAVENGEWLGEFTPNRAEIEQILDGEFGYRVEYGLTPQGGALWEEFSAPDWDQFVDASQLSEDDETEIAGADRRVVEEYYNRYYAANLGTKPVADFEDWEVLMPWQATYWKILPIGFKLRFSTMWLEDPEMTCFRDMPEQNDGNGTLPPRQWYTRYYE